MNKELKPKVIGIIGLIIATLGAVISAISLTGSGGFQESPLTGFHYEIPLMSDYGLKSGLFLLILGFLFQLIEKLNERISFSAVTGITLFAALIYIVAIRILPRIFFL